MKTIEYKLLSFPGESVQLPKEAVNIGNDFIDKIKKSKTKKDVSEIINEYPALRFIERERRVILRRANYIQYAKAESPRKKSFIDHIYLDLGTYYAYEKGRKTKNSEMINEIDSFHSRLYVDKYN
jgi:hypothetical protein